jgi:molybdate transport system permease protein
VIGRAAFDALLALCAGIVLAFLALPIVALFTQVPLGRVPHLLGEPAVRQALMVTARTTAIANALFLLVGTPAAYLLATRRFRGRSLLITIVELPLVLPPAVAGIALLAAVGRGGLFGDALANAGIVLPFSQWAVVLAVTFVASPFYVRQAISAFEAVDGRLIDAARTLGASPARTFARVSLPLAASGLATGWVLAFARGVGEFGAHDRLRGQRARPDPDADAGDLRPARGQLRRRDRARDHARRPQRRRAACVQAARRPARRRAPRHARPGRRLTPIGENRR